MHTVFLLLKETGLMRENVVTFLWGGGREKKWLLWTQGRASDQQASVSQLTSRGVLLAMASAPAVLACGLG